ncbi:MAG TPA: hypothetical protein PLQ93_12445 [Bacteroidia bacterium]|nr:hypothetical protein [Bacteroidia bacterium]
MKLLTRVRIILFMGMIFGAFANFALNEWGNDVMAYGELLIGLSFWFDMYYINYQRYKAGNRKMLSSIQMSLVLIFTLCNLSFVLQFWHSSKVLGIAFLVSYVSTVLVVLLESLYDLLKKKDNQGKFENTVIALFFFGLYFKNMAWPGANISVLLTALLLIPYYIITSVQFYNRNRSKGLLLSRILLLGSCIGVLLCFAYLFKMMHWPLGGFLYQTSMALALLYPFFGLRKSYAFNGEQISFWTGLSKYRTHIVFVYIAIFIFGGYRFLVIKKHAPDFYSHQLPAKVYKMREAGLTTMEKEKEHWNIINSYRALMDKARENGFVK